MNTAAPVSPSSSAALRGAAWIACAALVLVASRGLWPVMPVEGDDQGVLFGIEGMVSSSPERLARRYLFSIQPGSYDVLATAVRLTGASAQTAFATATAAGAALFAASGAWLLSAALSIPFVFALLAMLACQETVAAACYLNTSALAGGVALLSLVPFSRRSPLPLLLLGGAGLGFAGWLRGDALLVAPAALATYASVPADTGTLRTTRDAVLTLLSPALLLAALAGTLWLALRKTWRLLALLAAGVVPTVLAYGHALATPKYLYYTIPFALVPALALLRFLFEGRRRGTLPLLALAAATDAVAGVRVVPPEARYFSNSPAPVCQTFPFGSRRIELVLGGGDVIPNEDGFRLRTGQLFAAETWHREKLHQRACLDAIRTALEGPSDETVYFAGWLPEQLAIRELFAAGFHPENTAFSAWRRGAQTVALRYLGHVGSPFQPVGPAPAPSVGREPLLIGSYGGRVPPTELRDGRRWRAISEPAEGFVTLYRRAPQP